MVIAQQQPPLVPPQVIYGTATFGQKTLNRLDTQYKVSIRLSRLLVIFMDSYESQTLIGNIITQLNAGNTTLLSQAFLDSEYCSSLQPPLVLLSNATVTKEANNKWQVRSGQNIFTVLSQQIQVWNGVSWTNGNKLEVYQHNGLMNSYTMGELQTDNYALEVQISPNNVFWGNNTYLLRDPGRAIVGDEAFLYINDVMVTEPAMPLVIGADAFIQTNIKTPDVYNWSLNLNKGWSLISFGVNRCYYSGVEPVQPSWVQKINVASLGFNSLAEWFNSVVSPSQAWRMVIGQNGAMDSSLGPQFHSLKYFSPIESYWIRIDDSYNNATLSLQGQYYKPNIDELPLKDGWTYIAYPSMVGFYDTSTQPTVNLPTGNVKWVKVPAPVAAHVFGDVAGKYTMVIGQYGAYNPALGPEFSSLRYIAPGQGFQIKMNQVEDVIYPGQ